MSLSVSLSFVTLSETAHLVSCSTQDQVTWDQTYWEVNKRNPRQTHSSDLLTIHVLESDGGKGSSLNFRVKPF